jgi:glycosyltransferase involved in cell wall biosynthesis
VLIRSGVNSIKTILFVSHDASRTGAPVLLLRFLNWLKEHSRVSFELVLLKGGELQCDFEKLCPVILFDRDKLSGREPKTRALSWLRPISKSLAAYVHERAKDKRRPLGLVYWNTIVNGVLLKTLSQCGVPILCHVHELEQIIHSFGMENFLNIKECAECYIAASEAVKDNLVHRHGLPPNFIEVVYGFPSDRNLNSKCCAVTGSRVRRALGISEDAFVVIGAGMIEAHKGPDLFVQLANYVTNSSASQDVNFVWIGEPHNEALYANILGDIEKTGMQSKVRFLGKVDNPLDYFAAADVFALTSREEAFGLACIEAASTGCPIVCFDRSGGAKEFVGEDAGFIIPYLHVGKMAEKITALISDPKLREQLGSVAADKVRRRFDISMSAPKLLRIIQKYLV